MSAVVELTMVRKYKLKRLIGLFLVALVVAGFVGVMALVSKIIMYTGTGANPALALDGGIDGLDAYRAIASQAIHLLAPCGRLIVELGAGQEPAVRDLFSKAGLTVSGVRADLAGIPRALSACLMP